MSEWKTIDTAPKNKDVLCGAWIGRFKHKFWLQTIAQKVPARANDWISDSGDRLSFTPTHWQPLPDPPEDA